jgi:hypothetical protein
MVCAPPTIAGGTRTVSAYAIHHGCGSEIIRLICVFSVKYGEYPPRGLSNRAAEAYLV